MKILSKKYFHEINNNNNININDMKNNRNIVIHRNDGISSQQADLSNNNNNNDDTIYIDNYSDETSYETLENQEIDHPMDSKEPIKKPIYPTSKSDVDDFDYDNEYGYDDLDNDLVSSGNGKIVVDIKSIVKPNTQTETPFKQNRIRAMNEEDEPMEDDYKVEAVASEDNLKKPENVYSVSSEILISHVITQNEKQINTDKNQANNSEKSEESTTSDEVSEDDEDFADDWSGIEGDVAESRRSGNVRKSQEKSRQLLLCETAGTGELCRMLFKGSFG
jgi:hypothetical protein